MKVTIKRDNFGVPCLTLEPNSRITKVYFADTVQTLFQIDGETDVYMTLNITHNAFGFVLVVSSPMSDSSVTQRQLQYNNLQTVEDAINFILEGI